MKKQRRENLKRQRRVGKVKKANNLVLELSADLEEEEQPSQKKKPTIVDQEDIREKETYSIIEKLMMVMK